jgi:hypothetical protein
MDETHDKKSSPDSTNPLDGVAVCKKDGHQMVHYQSPESIAMCGEKTGEYCNECQSKDIPPTASRMESDRVYYHNQVYSRVTIQQDRGFTTIMVPDGEPALDIGSILDQVALSPREREIAILISNAQSNADIIATLVISESTLKSHLNSLYRKAPALKAFRERLR